jgi:hypothetical protein
MRGLIDAQMMPVFPDQFFHIDPLFAKIRLQKGPGGRKDRFRFQAGGMAQA